ncbi:MAG TPA: tetratricopeptide repeat protein [Nitrospirota bacterium]|nr:tetratricopeptide repeat protein [Nitrospirota bacterium]
MNSLKIKMLNHKVLLPFIIIAAISGIVYLNSLHNGFQYDDEPDIVKNTFLGKWENIPRFFTSVQFYRDEVLRTDHYRPLLYVTYSLNKIAGGNNPFGYHVVNLAFHIVSAMLLFMIIKAMLENGRGDASGFYIALTAALIFAVHPFNSETVNYITARSSLMSSFFYLLAFYCWVRYREGRGRGEKFEDRSKTKSNILPLTSNFSLSSPSAPPLTFAFYLASLLAFLLGMLSKEVVITLPVVLWLYDLYFVHSRMLPTGLENPVYRDRRDIRVPLISWRTYLPYLPFVLVVVIPAFVVRVIYWGNAVPSFKRSLPVQFYTELPVLVKHLRLFVFPVGLNVDHYSEVYRSFFEWPVAVSALILLLYLLLAVAAYRARSTEWRVVSFFMIWFFIVLLPTIVIPLNAIFQENRGYLAVIVFPVFAGVMLGKLMKIPLNPPFSKGGEGGFERLFSSKVKNYASVVILIILVLSYGAGTVYRNSVWRNGMSLWSDAVDKSPRSSRAHTNLGTEYSRLGRNGKAIEHFLKALRFPDPDDRVHLANIHYNLGTVYQQMGRDEMAMSEYKVVAEISPSDFRPHYNLGVIYQQKGEMEAAEDAYRRVIERNGSHFKSFHNLGILYQNRGDILPAEEFYKKALSLNPDYARSLFNLAVLYEGKGDLIKAKELYMEALKRNPGDSRIQGHIKSLDERLIFSPLP